MDDISSYVKIHLYKVSTLLFQTQFYQMGRDSSAGIATRNGLNSPMIESKWERNISHLSRPALGHTQPPIQWAPDVSQR